MSILSIYPSKRTLRRSCSQLELQLVERTVALQNLSQRLLKVQDEERRRVARDLHDSTGQTLTALKISITLLQQKLGHDKAISDELSGIASLVDQALQEIRTTSHLLHPPLLDEVGFSSAAQWYVDGFAKRSGIKASFELSAAPQLTKAAELVLFRVLQESLTNVLRHSGSEAVDIRLHSDDENAFLTIRDHGRGLPAEKLKSFHETGAGVGVGLAGMKQRVGELGGQLRVESDDKGTCLTATVPLAKAEKSACDHDRGGTQAATAA